MYKRLPASGFLLLLIAGLFSACSSLNEIRVAGTNFTDEIGQTQNLVFTFNKDLVPDSRLEGWDSVQYIRFEPAVKGQFRWTAPNELVFSPVAGFGAATAYKAHLTPALIGQVEKAEKLTVDQNPIEFHTPYLQLTGTESWWTLSQETNRQEARIKLMFNYPVAAAQIAEKLKLTIAGKAAGFRIVPHADEKLVIIAPESSIKADRNPLPVTITLDKGVKAQKTSFSTTGILSIAASLPSPLRLEITGVTTGFENNAPFVRIVTTQELQKESISQGFSLNPAADVHAEPTENGFILRGAFNETDTYNLLITKALKGILGTFPEEETSKGLFFGKMPESISFANKKALYLTPKGSRNVGVQIVNVPKVNVRIAKLYANNILTYIYHNRWEDYSYVGEQWQPNGAFQYNEDGNSDFSDVIVNKTIETSDLPKSKGIAALNIAIPDDNKRRGVYLVSVAAKDMAYLNATKLVSVSDIGLIVKQGKDDVWIVANSIKNNEPLADVEISLVSSNNQTIKTLTTDAQGIAHGDKISEKAPGFKLAMVTAATKDDFNFLLLKDTQTETSRFEVDGLRDNTSGFQAFIYGGRDIYRPGETAHFNTVVRSDAWANTADIPLKIRLVAPNGKELRKWRKVTGKQGAAETEISLEAASLTGSYILEVYNANDVWLASRTFNVEEFMPDRIKVDLSGAARAYASGSTVSITATATNLFGPPAANRTYEMESQLKRKGFSPAGFPEYNFDIPAESKFEVGRRQGTTNENGQATEEFALFDGFKDLGVLEGRIYVTVFDENGRPVNRLHQFDVFTQPVFYGIRLPDTYVGTNVPVPVDVVGVNSKGILEKNMTAQVEVIKMEYQTVVEKQYETLRYTSRKSEKTVYTQNLNLAAGKGSFRYVPTVSGEYEVRVRRPGALHYTSTGFYAYGYANTEYSSFEVSREGRILMETDKPVYHTGESAKVLFKTPFDGRLLVTVERNNVLEQHVLTTQKKAAELKIALKDSYLPNVFVTATLIRPLDNSDLPLTVAHGFIPIMLEEPDRKLPVTITAAEKSRSKTRQHIQIKTRPNAQLTVAVVDEGILQIKRFNTPDIYGHFYQKRALEVTSHDLYAQLFPELKISGASSSGGDGYDLERRINPLSNGRTELVAFWSGVLTADGSGNATFDVNVPQFSGDLRIMAVAYKDNAFGSATRNMKVADPIVISTGAPRFLSPGDELTLPVNISNTEKKTADATISLQMNGALAAGKLPVVQKMSIAPGKEGRAVFDVRAAQAIGTGQLTVKVTAHGETFIHQTDLNVRPASPLLKTSSSGSVAAGKQATIDFKSSFILSTSRARLVLGRSPLVQGGKALATLLGYPYGCLEQTVSKAFPQLYFADLTKAMAAPVYQARSGASDFNPVTNVQQAIKKAESLQLFSGGMGMWPGATSEDWWATAYALHFLEEARRAGFEVNGKTVSQAIDYLTRKTGSPASKEIVVATTGHGLAYGSEPSGGSQIRKTMARREAIYSLYVLAFTGHPNRAAMNYYKQNQQLLTLESRYMLAGAFQLSGDPRSFASLLPKQYIPERQDSRWDESYSSPLRNMALVLNTLLESDADNLQIPALARQLSKVIQSAAYINTQEAAFAVLALGKVARKTAGSTVTAAVHVNGKKLADFSGRELRLTTGILNQKVQLQTAGSGTLYWFAETEGMSATGSYTEEDQGLVIRREFLGRDGSPVKQIRQNDLIVVRLTLSTLNGLPVDNVVITDLLPAGFEIENPRLTEPREMPWIKNAAIPQYFDVRDDRLHLFTHAGAQKTMFYYQVRAVSKGTFTVGPAAADAMYQGEYHSYSGGGRIRVE
ncbi:alpha-2-macroglobulin family protein [Dyadobacter sandarakinus]|uniref:Alpha-2-macroglobulin family protein n=1 Tax=Dyadobacter sandarakinus TaxID=2747268 RepID=A0ABX7IAY8_9BACT|nr:MG2 domain-containing protein [Dyadobacter sandarakinus]QRR02978.1 alpha-2-macroglobulin family protein [Dyadobacter sandarakinus]